MDLMDVMDLMDFMDLMDLMNFFGEFKSIQNPWGFDLEIQIHLKSMDYRFDGFQIQEIHNP